MRKFKLTTLLAGIFLAATQACSLPGFVVTDPGAISTSAAQTVIASLTSGAQPPIQDSPTPVFTSTVGVTIPTSTPTFTLTPSATATPTLTLSATSSVAMISVSVPTNCRTGPGKVYERVGALMDGIKVEVFARNPTGEYWYIRNPNRPNRFCWIWGEYATLYGNYLALPVYTPIPTPTYTATTTPTRTPLVPPDFTAVYTGMERCHKNRWVEFRLKNTGGIDFRSMALTVKDTVKDITVSLMSNGFGNKNGCDDPIIRDVLQPGQFFVVSAAPFDYNPKGNKLRATITLCSQNGQNGTCVTNTVVFTP